MLLGILLIVLLLLPDFAEVAIPGLVSLKRKVALQERRQDALETRIQHFVSQSATAQVNQYIPFVADPSTFEQLSRRFDVLEGVEPADEEEIAAADDESEGDDEAAPVAAAAIERPEEEESALLAQELIRRWEDLSRAASQAESFSLRQEAQPMGSTGPPYGSPSMNRLVDWWRTFREELNYVRAARNSVVHARPLDVETLRQALELARRLQAALPEIGIFDDSDLRYMGVQFERRLQDWLRGQGVADLEVDARTRRRFDFIGAQADGRWVVAEAKVARRKVGRSTLVSWVAQLMDDAREFPGARLILAISGPGLTESSLEFAESQPVEIYLERRPGDFERITHS